MWGNSSLVSKTHESLQPSEGSVAQGVFVHDREQHLRHDAVRVRQGGLGESVEHVGLAVHAAKIGKPFPFDPPFSLGADLVYTRRVSMLVARAGAAVCLARVSRW